MKLALAWNVLGLLAVTDVVIRAVLTSPGPFNLIHVEVSNRMFGTFPFMFIPGFFVPLAVTLHVLAIRATISGLRAVGVSNRNAGETQIQMLQPKSSFAAVTRRLNCRLNSIYLWAKMARHASTISPQHARRQKAKLLRT